MRNQPMKIATIIAFAIGTISFIGCGSTGKPEHNSEGHGQAKAVTEDHAAHAHAHYQCPMDCENGKMYEQVGKCPVCKMDLEEVSEGEVHAEKVITGEHDHDHAFACPMHPEITGHEGDKCSKCGMNLEKVEG